LKPRLRDFGIEVGRLTPGQWNAITDVPGVRVGHTTLNEGHDPLIPGHGPVRTGVTAIIPHAGSVYQSMIPASIALNGGGEITGRSQVDEYGVIETPILIPTRSRLEWSIKRASNG